jgi:hypothetical protein
MASRTPIAVERSLRTLGQHVAAWRKLQRVTAAQLLRVLRVLGVMEAVVAAADPYSTDVGKLRVDEQLPQRVRG